MASTNSNETAHEIDENSHDKLAAYRNAKGKTIIAASLLIPFGTVAFFVLFCQGKGGEYALDASVKIGDMQRIALIVQGIYFILLPDAVRFIFQKATASFGGLAQQCQPA